MDWFVYRIFDGHDGVANGSLYNDPRPRVQITSGQPSVAYQLCVYWRRDDGDDSAGGGCSGGGLVADSLDFGGQTAYGCCATGPAPQIELDPDRDGIFSGGLTDAFNGQAYFSVRQVGGPYECSVDQNYAVTFGDGNSPQGGLCSMRQ